LHIRELHKEKLANKVIKLRIDICYVSWLCINICHYVNFERIYILNAIIIDGLIGLIFLNCKDNFFLPWIRRINKPPFEKKRVKILSLGFLDGERFESIKVNFELSPYYDIGWLQN
jgi:hypothetical protein